MKNMNILITGGSGFIGTYLVADLINQGQQIVIYDKLKSKTYPDHGIIGDVRDKEKLTGAMQGIDAVFHLAAEHHDDVRPVSLYYEVNVGGAENLMCAMEKTGVNKLIFTSTVALYGLNPGIPDETSTVKPFNDYGKSKYQAEIVLKNWAKGGKDRCLTIVRPTAIFGQNNRGNVYNLLSQIASGRFIMVGNGKNKKSMGYVRNLSHFLTMLLNQDPGVHIYNYADKPDYTMAHLVKLVLKTLSHERKLKLRLPYPVGLAGGYAFDALAKITGKTFPISSIRIKKFCADTQINADKVNETGFSPPFSLDEGLKRMIQMEFGMRSEGHKSLNC
jgi:nucleoside-diphosphate-sugar epimerase